MGAGRRKPEQAGGRPVRQDKNGRQQTRSPALRRGDPRAAQEEEERGAHISHRRHRKPVLQAAGGGRAERCMQRRGTAGPPFRASAPRTTRGGLTLRWKSPPRPWWRRGGPELAAEEQRRRQQLAAQRRTTRPRRHRPSRAPPSFLPARGCVIPAATHTVERGTQSAAAASPGRGGLRRGDGAEGREGEVLPGFAEAALQRRVLWALSSAPDTEVAAEAQSGRRAEVEVLSVLWCARCAYLVTECISSSLPPRCRRCAELSGTYHQAVTPGGQ